MYIGEIEDFLTYEEQFRLAFKVRACYEQWVKILDAYDSPIGCKEHNFALQIGKGSVCFVCKSGCREWDFFSPTLMMELGNQIGKRLRSGLTKEDQKWNYLFEEHSVCLVPVWNLDIYNHAYKNRKKYTNQKLAEQCAMSMVPYLIERILKDESS